MDWEEKMTQEQFGGNRALFEEAYEEAVREGSMYALSWEDIELGAIALPELEEITQQLIENYLGYLPHPSVLLKYEPYIRALVHSHKQNSINDYEFEKQVVEQVKLIRNEDMDLNTCLNYDADIYQNYHENYHGYRTQVKERLIRFLGYAPKLEHSLVAEMWMQDCLADDTFQICDEITAIDYKAITLIKYREVLLRFGFQEANDSPLWVKSSGDL